MTFEQIKKLDTSSAMPTYGRFDAAFDRGEGATLWDVEGKKYIDFSSGIGVNSLGHRHPAWLAAVEGQLSRLAHTSNLYYNEATARLTDKLTSFCPQGSRVFMANSGAEANEGMIKLARKYSFDRYGEGRNEIISLKGSFHGRTLTTLSATGQDVFHQFFHPFTEGFVYADANMDSVESLVNERTCAVMFETIQGEGGVIPLDEGFLSELWRFARERDILLLADEVQTGIGRTGSLFSFPEFPDVFSLAKGLGGGLPIGAVVATEKCAEVLGPSTHGSTFGGNPVAAAGALAVLETVGNEEFLASVVKKGEYIRDGLKKRNLPVSEIRGRGLMLGIDIEGVEAKPLCAALLKNGLVSLSAKTSLRFLPPLVISYEEIDEGLDILKSTLEEMK